MWYIVWYNHATAYPMYTNTAKPYFYTSYKLHSASYSHWYSIYWWTNDCSYSAIEEVQIVKMVPTFCVKMFCHEVKKLQLCMGYSKLREQVQTCVEA